MPRDCIERHGHSRRRAGDEDGSALGEDDCGRLAGPAAAAQVRVKTRGCKEFGPCYRCCVSSNKRNLH